MKITIKTLKGELFTVEAEPTDTIESVKTKIKDQKGFDVEAQKLVFKGKNTVNGETIETLGIKEGDFMVVMVTQKKPEPPKEAPKPVEIPKTTAPAVTVPPAATTGTVPPAATTGSTGPAGGDGLVTGEQYEQSVQNLMGMGFSREEVVGALRAAFNNPERAVEYLVNGVPTMPVGPAPGANTGAPVAPGATGAPGTGGVPGLDASMLATLIGSPQFAHIRQMIRNDPSSLPVFLQQIAQTSPQLFQLISQNPELFERLIMQEGGEVAPAPGAIHVTAEEKAAIERISALGFSKIEAAQAYLACDKNEQLAANLLFDRLANGDIEPGGAEEGGPEEEGDDDGHDDDNLFS